MRAAKERREDALVVVEDVALRGVQGGQETLFEEVEPGSELSLEPKEIGALAVGVGPFDAEDLVERLRLETGPSDLDRV